MPNSPRVLITGAGRGVGRACAEALAGHGAELILCDKDIAALDNMAKELGAAGRFCNVASEADVAKFAAGIIDEFASLDMVINAAGGGYERTLGMYRVSRALLPALGLGTHKLLLNIPPSVEDAGTAIFPYASSGLAFQRLSAALAHETRGTSIAVLVGCPSTGRVTQVLPDPNAGTWADSCKARRTDDNGVAALAGQIVSLLDRGPASRLRAG